MTTTNTNQAVLNQASPGTLAALLQALKFGDIVRAMPVTLTSKAPADDESQLTDVQSLGLADDARAAKIARAYARTGTGTAAELTVAAVNATPSAGEIAIAPNGDIVCIDDDAWTAIDVVYWPMKGDVVTLQLPVQSSIAAIPAIYTARGVLYLIRATADTATTDGAKIVIAPGSAPTTSEANLNLAKTQVQFDTDDVVTVATVTLLVASLVDVDAQLQATSSAYI